MGQKVKPIQNSSKTFKQNMIFIFIIICFVLFIPIFNYVIDPYNIFSDKISTYKPYQSENDRDTIYPKLKMMRYKSPDIVMFGDSDTGTCFSESDFKEITGKNLAIISLSGASIQEMAELIKSYVKLYPDIKNITINLKIFQFEKQPVNYLPEFSYKLTTKEIYKVLFSISTTKYSFLTFYKVYWSEFLWHLFRKIHAIFPQFNKKKIHIENRRITPYFREKHDNKELPEENFDTLKELILFLNERNIKTEFILSPLHAMTFVDIYETGNWSKLNTFKKKLADITPYYDFAYINKYSSIPLDFDNIYFTDPIHSETPLGKLIITKLYKENIDIGIKITKANCLCVLKEQTKLVEKYIQENKDIVAEFMSHDLYDTTSKIQYLEVE